MEKKEKVSFEGLLNMVFHSKILMVITMLGMVFVLLTFLSVGASAATYYVDSVNGLDTNDGTSTSTPWQTITKVNATTFASGDQILLKCGCTWREQTLVPSSSNITIGSYGTGDKPVISGGRVVSGFTTWFGSIYQVPLELSSEPYLVKSNDDLLRRSSYDIEEGMLFRSFRWQDNVLYVNDRYGNPDTLGKTIEVAVMAHCIVDNDKDNVTIDGLKLTMTGGALIRLEGGEPDHWTIRNCDLSYAESGYLTDGAGITLSGADYTTISNNVISNVKGDGIMVWNSTNNTITGNNISKVYSGINTGGDGIQLCGKYSHSASDNTITNNYINMQGLNTGKGCIQTEDGNNVVISGNTCLYGNYGIESDGNNNIIEKNYCAYAGTESGATWAAGLYSSDPLDTSGSIWRYNVVENCPYNAMAFVASANKRSNIKIYNNTIYNCGNGIKSSSPFSGELKNNILWNVSGLKYNFPTIITGETFVSDYNLIGGEGAGTYIKYIGTSYDTLAAFQSAIGQDLNSITSDPLFINAAEGDYHLQSTSPAKDTGVDVGLTTDIEGSAVPQGNGVDMGAYETTSDPLPPPLNTGLAVGDFMLYASSTYLENCNGGFGWEGAWIPSYTANSDYRIKDTQSLTYTGLVVPSGTNKYANFKNNAERHFAEPIDASTQPVWVSYLVRSEITATNYFYTKFYNDTTPMFIVKQHGTQVDTDGDTVADAYPWILDKGNSTTNSGSQQSSLKGTRLAANLIVLKLDGSTVQLWANPVVSDLLGDTPPAADAEVTCDNNIIISGLTFNGGGANGQADNIRIGYSLASVLQDTEQGQ